LFSFRNPFVCFDTQTLAKESNKRITVWKQFDYKIDTNWLQFGLVTILL